MVVSKVTGPTISRMKSIQTPSGTVNGLAVDATNKFAITPTTAAIIAANAPLRRG